MNERAWERTGAVSGLVAAVLLLVSFFLNPLPPPGEDAAAIFFYVAGYSGTLLLAALFTTLAAVVFLWFVGYLRHLLQRAEGGAEAFSPVVFAAGVSLAMMAMLSTLPIAALAALTRHADAANRPTVFVLSELHRLSLGGLGMLVALFAGTAGAAMLRRELVGPWLGWLGLVMALIGLIAGVTTFYAGSVFITIAGTVTGVLFALWIGAACLVMLLRPEVDRAPAAGAAFAH